MDLIIDRPGVLGADKSKEWALCDKWFLGEESAVTEAEATQVKIYFFKPENFCLAIQRIIVSKLIGKTSLNLNSKSMSIHYKLYEYKQ